MRAIRQYVVFSFLTSLAISAIVVEYVPFLRRIGFSLSGVALLNLGYVALIAIVEVPTGVFADMRGCKSSVRWSQVIYIVGACLYGLSQTRELALVAMPFTAVSFAMQSGARQSWLMSQIMATASPVIARKAFADSTLAAHVGAVLGPMTAAMVKVQCALNCFWYSALLSALALFMTMFWADDEPVARPHQRMKEVFLQGRDAALQYPLLRWLGWMSLLFAFVSVVNHQWSLAVRESSWQVEGQWVWMAMQAGLMAGSFAYRQFGHVDAPRAMAGSLVIAGLCLVMATRSPDATWMVFIVSLQVTRSFFQVARDYTVQNAVPSEVRATAASWISLAGQIGMMAMLGFSTLASAGRHTALAAMQMTWVPAGAMLGFGAIGLYGYYRRKAVTV